MQFLTVALEKKT